MSPSKILPILILLALTSTVPAQTYRTCQKSPEDLTVHYRTAMVNRKILSLPNREWNLLYQLHRNPCVELQYSGLSIRTATQYTIYATCDYRRMFRFTAHQTYYSCWRMDMAIWDRTTSGETGYRRHPVTEGYDISFAPVYMSVTMTRGNSTYCAVLVPARPPAGIHLPHSQVLNILRHRESNRESDPADRDVECDCGKLDGNQSQADLWLKVQPDLQRDQWTGWDFMQTTKLGAMFIALMVIGDRLCRFFVER